MNESQFQQQSNKMLGKNLLRIAVVADTHLTEADGVCNSPFKVNKLANDRLRYVVDTVNHIAPDFSIHLGDIVHPVPAVPSLYEKAVNCFREQIKELKSDMMLVPGNHDVGDKPIDWGPAGVICEEYVTLWDEYFGPNYTAEIRQGCHFIILNAQLINTGFDSETKQREWFEDYLASNPGGRFFVSLHYPPYLLNAEEREHYDNIAEPGRSWFLDLLVEHRVEALFAGHVHHFWTYRHAETDCYLLPSTAFARQDYSEMFRNAPSLESEFGRNDVQKLGYLLLEIYEHGHLCRPIRTEGLTQSVDAEIEHIPMALRLPFPPHPRQQRSTGLGFDMSKDWLTEIEIPPSGGLDEFDRKSVRNDYPIMGLWEMGVRRLRIPRADLDDRAKCERIKGLFAQGMRFTLFSFDVPDTALLSQVLTLGSLFEAWEIAIPLHKSDQLVDVLLSLQGQGKDTPPVYLSKLRGKDDVEKHQGTYYHVINHGFSINDEQAILSFKQQQLFELIDGLVFRVGCAESVVDAAIKADKLVQQIGKKASIHVRMGSENPAEQRWDENWTSCRVAQATLSAHTLPAVRLFIDTLADVDRGYFPRMGVLDGLWNPRDSFHVLRSLNAVLSQFENEVELISFDSTAEDEIVEIKIANKPAFLVLPKQGSGQVELSKGIPIANVKGFKVINLVNAKTSDLSVSNLAGQSVIEGFDTPFLLTTHQF